MANGAFPLSFRSVDETEYKKAMLLFYERNNCPRLREFLWNRPYMLFEIILGVGFEVRKNGPDWSRTLTA
jgi:hypothetical protein